MINSTYFLLNVFLLAVGTLSIRGCFIALSNRMNITPKLRELFTFIPASIFPALIMPGSFFHQGSVLWLGGKERFVILLLAGVACYFVRNTLFVISFGLTLLYVVSQI